MASEYCLTCGHTKNSHVFVEVQHVLKDGEKSGNYCKVKPCDCKQFRI
jgi:predicted Zn-ribbon and HTH transcriptional regulator